ncbi:MAG: hypothetical protein H6617_03055 [Bdellovibrionaceae bacterium]|nr:hypothetical protein [Bdellovibrionales bacterium]MCB9253638.1 hypothetical protein [Pseudobdellovibrionaceae bacterium]
MPEKDLPEPQHRQYTAEERRLRKQNLLITLLGFCTAYAQLHKLIIPLVLKLTPLHVSPYSKIDFWFLHSLLFFFLLRKTRKLGPLGSLLAGVGILYGVFEVYEVFLGRLGGWLAFSRLLSSVPISFCCGLLMTVKDIDRRLGYAWAGVGILALSFLPNEKHFWEMKAAPQEETSKTVSAEIEVEAFTECGATEVRLQDEAVEFLRHHPLTTIEVRPCGFYPAILDLPKTLRLSNPTNEALNIHYLAFKNGKQSASWNIVLKPQQSLQKRLERAEAAIVYSDSLPKAGLSALIDKSAGERWIWTRSPISVRRVDEF